MSKELFYWLPALLCAALIFWLSHQSQPPGTGWGPDYLGHLIAYAGFALTLIWGKTRAFRNPLSSKDLFTLGAVAVLYAVSDELHQSLVPQRVPSLKDVFADFLGIALCLVVARTVGLTGGR